MNIIQFIELMIQHIGVWRKYPGITVGCFSVCIVCLMLSIQEGVVSESISKLQDKYSRSLDNISSIQHELDSANRTVANLRQTNSDLRHNMQVLELELSGKERTISIVQGKLDVSLQKIEILNRRIRHESLIQ